MNQNRPKRNILKTERAAAWARIMGALLLLCLFLTSACAETIEEPGFLKVENGVLQPVIEWSDLRDDDYTNEGKDILRFCVWVETDYDTDLDGKADLVKTLVQVPRAAVEGKYKAAVIYDPTPYGAGTVERYENDMGKLYVEKYFDESRFYQECEKREPAGIMTSAEAAEKADYNQWNYTTPDETIGFGYANDYDYFLIRGFAVVEASGIGTYGSEGFELCGTKLERDSHKAVVEWLTGDRRAFTDPTSNMEIKADWCNGNVAMTGCSYGGTIPFEVAVTGVKGLKTIIPFAGIASWYDYTNSQGIPICLQTNYTDSLAANNAGAAFLDDQWEVINPEYGSWLWTIATEEEKTNGNYAPIWEEMDYTTDEENHIACSALVVSGLNDTNVTTRQAELMVEAFQKAGKTVKLVLHQDGHNNMSGISVNGRLWEEIMNEWLSHYLYGVDNNAESLPAVMAQNNTDGVFEAYPDWPGAEALSLTTEAETETTTVHSDEMGAFFLEFQDNYQVVLSTGNQEDFYSILPDNLAAVYRFDVPANTTIQGVPALHVKLDSEQENLDGLMITAVLMDVSDAGTFKAYMRSSDDGERVTRESLDQFYDIASGLVPIQRLKQTNQPRKMISIAWTDLQNPGCGKASSEYTLQSCGLISGLEQDYTFYFQPTVYTMAEGHHLELILLTWDPYRVDLETWYKLDGTEDITPPNIAYSMTINNASLRLDLPIGKGDPNWMEESISQ